MDYLNGLSLSNAVALFAPILVFGNPESSGVNPVAEDAWMANLAMTAMIENHSTVR